MPRINLKPGDSGTVTVDFAGDVWQDFVTFTKDCLLTLSPHGVSAYVQDRVSGNEYKFVDGTTETWSVIGQRSYDVKVTGSGTVDYSVADLP